MLAIIGKSHFMRNSYKYTILRYSLKAKVDLTKKCAISQNSYYLFSYFYLIFSNNC